MKFICTFKKLKELKVLIFQCNNILHMSDTSLQKLYKFKIIEVVIYSFLFLLFVRLVYMQIISGPDYGTHLKIIDKYVQGHFYIPHPGFHITIFCLSKITSISYASITPFFMAFIIVLTIFITKKILIYLSPGISSPFIYLLFSIAINFVIAIYIPFFNREMYLGQWSPNIWHSPTMSFLKPFALLCFFWLIQFLKNRDNLKQGLLFLTSVSLLIGTFIKPSFIICLLPAVTLYLLIFRFRQYNLYLKIFWIFLPSLLLLSYQFIETYNLENTSSYFHDKIILTWFGVDKIYTKSILISTLLVLAFPFCILVFSYRRIKQNIPLLLSWILIVTSFFISNIFAESNKFGAGAFIFSYIICLFILFVFSLSEYLNWFVEFKKNWLKISVAGIIFSFHLVSGIFYFSKLIVHGSL
jgi:hypothetical protein